MKYKDLQVGDWFIYNKNVWMKCQFHNGTINNLCISGGMIGVLFPALLDDTDVDFCSRFWANTPYMVGDGITYGLCELFDTFYNVYAYILETNSIIMKCFVDGIEKQMIVSLNGNNAGHWCKMSINYSPILLKNNFWLEFPERT